MKKPRLPALEKNVLKYRALQMVLMLQEFESLKRFIIGSIRATDRISRSDSPRLPPGCKKPLEKALDVLIGYDIISSEEKSHVLEFSTFRNRIGHEMHRLVEDVTHPDPYLKQTCLHDYWALDRLENLSHKISSGMGPHFVLLAARENVVFEQAELAFKEELDRWSQKIQRQISVRLSRSVPNNSFKPKPLRGSA